MPEQNTMELPQEFVTLDQVIAFSDIYIRQEYLSLLSNAQPMPLETWEEAIQPGTNLRMIHLCCLTLNETDTAAQRLASVYHAVTALDASAFLLLDGRADSVNLYLGISSMDGEERTTAFRTFISSFTGSFPGCQFRNVKEQESRALMQEIFPAEPVCVSAIPALPSDADGSLSQGLEKLCDGMAGQPFSMILMGCTLARETLARMRRGYEELYTQLSPFEKQTFSKSQSDAVSYSKSVSQAISQSVSSSSGLSWGSAHTEGTSESTQYAQNAEDRSRDQAGLQIAGAAASMMIGTLFPAAGAGNMLQNLFYGQSMGNLLGNLGKAADVTPDPGTTTRSTGSNVTDTQNIGMQSGESRSASGTETDSQTAGVSGTQGKTFQVVQTNKSISDQLFLIDRQIQRLREIESGGAFQTCAYFVANDMATSLSAASLYRSVCGAGKDDGAACPILTWEKDPAVKGVLACLSRGMHPLFGLQGMDKQTVLSPALPFSVREFAFATAIPKKSLPGFVVTRHAAFARDVIAGRGAGMDGESIPVGHIYHMGRTEHTPVTLSMEALRRHLFVTGTTGAGKSNFCYGLIDHLTRSDVHVLVVEPAKGEYAHVFGGRKDFTTLGTNSRLAPVLRINPFAFPAGIHILEHIDRLIGIFNASWPMYAAMPAILKEALELCYVSRGFDLEQGDCPADGKFPTFRDLLSALPQIIDRSDYSGEVKGNYRGALLSRVRSMTNGLYSQIFNGDEMDSSALFDGNVLIDISRAGSAETKALLMGVLVMRLSEYRMCSGDMNAPLRHVTILEEAHHLLRGQNQVSAEGVSLAAASAEMLINAIAEMRTYGEGFLIADQSPAFMDAGVIRNTNTKVVFCLHEREDCRIMGSALALDDAQTGELARLDVGVAAVYQNSWTDAILCKTDYFDLKGAEPFHFVPQAAQYGSRETLGQLLSFLIKDRVGESGLSEETLAVIERERYLYGTELGQFIEDTIKYVHSVTCTFPSLITLLERAINPEELLGAAGDSTDIARWAACARAYVSAHAVLTDAETNELIALCLNGIIHKKPELRKLYFRFAAHSKSAITVAALGIRA